jgi:DNA-directed RNA polymerase subunit RPC12/RpoP
MAFDDRPQRQIHDVSSLGIVCVECGTPINELPFMPNKREDGSYGKIYCRDCNKKRPPRGGFRG